MTTSLHTLIAAFLVLLPSLGHSAPPDQLTPKLMNTAWEWHNSDDYVQAGGQTVLKDGAWTEVRFRPDGRCNAWHNADIVYEGKWEVIAPLTVRITPRNDIGLVLNFHGSMAGFTVANERTSTGKFKGRAPGYATAVGRWRWPNGDIIKVREDGRAFSPGGQGLWKSVASDKIEINWRGGAFIDTLRVMSGGDKVKCKNQKGHEWIAERAVEAKK